MDTEDVEDTYVRTAARMSRMSLPIFVSCRAALSNPGILGPSWHPLWEPESPRRALSELRFYQWDSLYHRMRPYLPSTGRGLQNASGRVIFEVCRYPTHPVLATKRG